MGRTIGILLFILVLVAVILTVDALSVDQAPVTLSEEGKVAFQAEASNNLFMGGELARAVFLVAGVLAIGYITVRQGKKRVKRMST